MMVCDSAGPEPAGGARTSGSGRPRGNPNLAPRCGAKTRAGLACQAPGMANGRCRIHGGASTGPRTPKGLASLAAAHTTGGTYAAANWIRDRYSRVLACRIRLFCAAKLLRAYLPPALAARLATTPPEFMPPVHYSNTLNSEITTKTLWSGGRDHWGPSTARSRPGPPGRAEESLRRRGWSGRCWRRGGRRSPGRGWPSGRRWHSVGRLESREPDKDPMERRPLPEPSRRIGRRSSPLLRLGWERPGLVRWRAEKPGLTPRCKNPGAGRPPRGWGRR